MATASVRALGRELQVPPAADSALLVQHLRRVAETCPFGVGNSDTTFLWVAATLFTKDLYSTSRDQWYSRGWHRSKHVPVVLMSFQLPISQRSPRLFLLLAGRITLSNWATALESVLRLGLPWRMLRPQLVRSTADGMLEYKCWLDDLAMEQRSQEVRVQPLLSRGDGKAAHKIVRVRVAGPWII